MLTSSKNFIKRLFLISLFFSTIVFAKEFTKPFVVEKTLKANSTFNKLIKVDKNKLLIGFYKLSSNIKRIDLLNKDKVFVRRLDTPLKLAGRFIFNTKISEDYYISIQTLDKDISYKLTFHKILDAFYDDKLKEEEILSTIIKEVKKDLETNSSTKEFWKKVKKLGTPLVEKIDENNSLITFLYKGAKHNVKLLGGPTHKHSKLKRLANSDIWYKSFKVKNGLRLSYQIAPDVPSVKGSVKLNRIAILTSAQIDPYNKNPYLIPNVKDKYFQHSSLELENENEKWHENQNSKKGSLESFEFDSKILQNKRNISIYKPYDYSNKINDYNLLFVFDGVEYQNKINTPLILDNLIQKKKIKPTIAVFIDNISYKIRSKELPTNPKFADFMAKELLPYVSKKLNTKFKPENTVLAGSSYGGLASAYVAYMYPQYFKKVLSLSGSFWWNNNTAEPEWLSKLIATNKTKDVTFYLNAGIYETGHFSIDILESNRHLRTVLQAKDYKITYKEVEGGHDYFSWRKSFSKGLITLFN